MDKLQLTSKICLKLDSNSNLFLEYGCKLGQNHK